MKSTTFAAALFAVTIAANAETETIVETFESNIGGWDGGTLSTTETPPTEPDKYGYPVAGANHNQTLSVSGTATRTTSGNNVFDMMVKLNKTDDEELPMPPDASALFAVAVDNSGNLNLYCKSTPNGTASWSPLGQYNSGAWARLTFAVDDNARSFVVATNGVLTDATYYLAAAPSENIVTNVAVIGTTAIDDFVAKSGNFEPYAQVNGDGAAAATDDVPDQYIAQAGSGMTAASTIPNSSPTMTVAEAYQVGVLPTTDGATFDIKDATFDGSHLTLTFPGDWPAGTYTIKYGTTTECENTVTTFTSAVKSNGRNRVTVEIPQENFGNGNVLYYTVSR